MDTTATADVTLRVVGINLDLPETGKTLATHFPSVIWEENDDVTTLTMSVPSEDFASQALNVWRRMESAVPGLKFEGVDRDYVNATDIASRVDLSREAVRKWTSRADFPKPEAVVGGDSVKIWAWTQIVQWLRDVRGIDMDESLLTRKQMTQLENCLMGNPDHTAIQWQQAAASPARQSVPVAVKAPQRGTGQRVVTDVWSGRGQSSADLDRTALVAASSGRS